MFTLYSQTACLLQACRATIPLVPVVLGHVHLKIKNTTNKICDGIIKMYVKHVKNFHFKKLLTVLCVQCFDLPSVL